MARRWTDICSMKNYSPPTPIPHSGRIWIELFVHLWSVFHKAARVIFLKHKFNDLTFQLQTLQWIPPALWIKLKSYYNLLCVLAKSLQSCPNLWDPMDCSLPNSSVLGIPQARILEWVAISFSRGSSQLRDGTQVSSALQVDSLLPELPGKPTMGTYALLTCES